MNSGKKKVVPKSRRQLGGTKFALNKHRQQSKRQFPSPMTKDEAMSQHFNNDANVQETNSIPLLELDTLDMLLSPTTNCNCDTHKNTDKNNQPKSPSMLSITPHRRKRSRFAIYPVKNDEELELSSSMNKHKTATTLVNNNGETSDDDDVIEVTPTEKTVASKINELLKLKRKIPIKRIDFGSCPSPKHTTQMENITLKDKVNIRNLSPIKTHNVTDNQIKKSIEARNIHDFVCEDETFYLPAEQTANRNEMDHFNLDTENKPPKKTTLLDKFNVRSKRKNISKQLNTRCKADRAKLNGWDCWECRQYYEMLSLSEEDLKKRKNQCSRHRYEYERPNTPEGFWDPEFPETSSTY